MSATWEPFPDWTVIEAEGLQVGFVGLSAPSPLVEGRDPVEAANAAVRELPPVDVVVVLSNLGDTENLRVAREVEGIGLILATKGSSYDQPREEGGRALLEVADRGRYVNIAHLQLQSESTQPVHLEEAFDFVRYDEYRRARARRGVLEPSEEELALAAEMVVVGAGRNLVTLEERPLGSAFEGDSPVSARLDLWRSDRMTEARATVRAEPAEYSPGYATAAACTSCHTTQFARYSFTNHRGAGSTLQAKGRQDDPECLGCHTTGFGQPGGFADTTPAGMRKWGGVQCESCHGPLAGHPSEERAVPARVDEETCLACHDEANSPNFDYDRYLLDVICPAG